MLNASRSTLNQRFSSHRILVRVYLRRAAINTIIERNENHEHYKYARCKLLTRLHSTHFIKKHI